MEISPCYTDEPKFMIICYMVPEMYGAWRMELSYSIFGYCLPFSALTALKKKNSKTWKQQQQQQQQKLGDIIITSAPKIIIICYTVPEIYGVWQM